MGGQAAALVAGACCGRRRQAAAGAAQQGAAAEARPSSDQSCPVLSPIQGCWAAQGGLPFELLSRVRARCSAARGLAGAGNGPADLRPLMRGQAELQPGGPVHWLGGTLRAVWALSRQRQRQDSGWRAAGPHQRLQRWQRPAWRQRRRLAERSHRSCCQRAAVPIPLANLYASNCHAALLIGCVHFIQVEMR